MSKLLPCPRCGQLPQENRWHFYGKNRRGEMRYICANESCPEYNLKAMIIDEWNRRVYPPDLSELIFVCGKLLEYRKNNTISFQLEKLDDYLALIRAALEGLETKK